MIDLNQKLTPHFTVREMLRSNTAQREGIENLPEQEHIDNARLLSKHVFEPTREEFGPLSPQSWFRGEELEKFICKSAIDQWLKRRPEKTVQDYLARKDHPKGYAGDIEKIGVSNYDLACWIRDNCQYKQLILEFPNVNDDRAGWVHVSYDPNELRMECLTTTRVNGRILWRNGILY
jgi:hypothetical protein